MEITFSPGPDWIGRAAEIGTIAAIVISIAALTVAILEMQRNGKQRQQEARFNYAKRAMKLHDLLKLDKKCFFELDEQLAAKMVDYNQGHLNSILPIDLENIIHEAKVTSALSKSVTQNCPSHHIVEYMSVLKTCKDEHIHHEALPIAAKSHLFVGRMTGMYKADEKHSEIAKSLGILKPYTHLSESLFAQIENAYQG